MGGHWQESRAQTCGQSMREPFRSGLECHSSQSKWGWMRATASTLGCG